MSDPSKTAQTQSFPHILAIASGKGGVGKSTMAINLAGAFQKLGLNVGLLDADVYGPSLPTMLGIQENPEISKDKKIIPHWRFGMSCMSMGFLTDPDKALIWRGPMIQMAVKQLFNDVDWNYHRGKLDIMIVDMPPGTGDIALSLVQKGILSSVAIVSTPQRIAIADVIKAISMFQKLMLPIMGVVENMSFLECSHCGEVNEIFSGGNVEEVAKKFNVPFLGKIPFSALAQECTEQGQFLFEEHAKTKIAAVFLKLAEDIWQNISDRSII